MGDPVSGALGALVLSGWVAEAPTGHDEAYLMVTTPDPGAPQTMLAVAAVLGLDPTRPGGRTDAAVVEVGADGWATLVAGGEQFTRPVNGQWREVALARRQVVLVVGTAPMPEGMDADVYTDRYGHQAIIGLAPVR